MSYREAQMEKMKTKTRTEFGGLTSVNINMINVSLQIKKKTLCFLTFDDEVVPPLLVIQFQVCERDTALPLLVCCRVPTTVIILLKEKTKNNYIIFHANTIKSVDIELTLLSWQSE